MYQNNFSNNRNVKIRGEAYFKVAKNGRKFKVDAGNTLVEVLGTEFSVNRSDSVTRVVVAQGRVKFSNKTNNKNNVKLVAGDEGVFNASKMKLTKTINRSENSLAWVNHRLVFTNANMDNVIMDLENYFHVRIITGDEVKTCLFSGSFENPELNNVLEVIALSTGSLIKKENNIFYLEGSSCIK
jgi:ferric-dicitrate binding protein FerR (iron transport regulator)